MKCKFLHFIWSIATQLGIKLKHMNAIFPRYRAAEENHKHCNMFSSPSSKNLLIYLQNSLEDIYLQCRIQDSFWTSR